MATCKGAKRDGAPCQSPIVMPNGYCVRHQDQARRQSVAQEPSAHAGAARRQSVIPPEPEPQAIACEPRGDLWCLLLCLAGSMALVLGVAALLRRLWRALQDA